MSVADNCHWPMEEGGCTKLERAASWLRQRQRRRGAAAGLLAPGQAVGLT